MVMLLDDSFCLYLLTSTENCPSFYWRGVAVFKGNHSGVPFSEL